MSMDCTEYVHHLENGERLIGGLRIARIDGEKCINYDYNGGILYKTPLLFSYEEVHCLVGEINSYISCFLQHSEPVSSLSSIANGQIMG